MRKDESAAKRSPPLPIPNSYWVEPGRLLAGEYPGSFTRADTLQRLQSLLRAGVDSFIDLTEEGELPAYRNALGSVSEQRIAYQRLPITDHSVPDVATMSRILDALEAELGAGRRPYVHCRAGIGRTGMTVACFLTRSGLTGPQALERLQVLWRQCARSDQWRSVPETEEQAQFVRRWNEPASPARARPVTLRTRKDGALFGLAVGEVFGLRAKAGGVSAAELASQGSMTLPGGADIAQLRCVVESLLVRGTYDAGDQLQRYVQWSRGAPANEVPSEMRRALASWQWSKKPHAGSHDPNNLDAHSVARTLAIALTTKGNAAAAIDLAADVSRTTQQSPVVLDLCRLWVALLLDALAGIPKIQLVSWSGPATQSVRARALRAPVVSLIEGRVSPAGADALSAISLAVASFAATQDFRDGLLRMLGAARTSSTACALFGTLAGAHYGLDGIPEGWRRVFADQAALQALAERVPA
jgi:ADP-ribosylglycohydrolase